MNLCRTCGNDFGSVLAFDRHRTGSYEYRFSLEHPEGRRCRDESELLALGFSLNCYGRWTLSKLATRRKVRA
jgi:hypothetical protein